MIVIICLAGHPKQGNALLQAGNDEIHSITLDDVISIAEQESPYYREMQEALQATEYSLEAELQRNNPSLNYDLEFLRDGADDEVEQMLFLEQTFERPGLYRSREQQVNYRIESEQYAHHSRSRKLFADLRGAYAALVLTEHHIETQQRILDDIEQLAEIARLQADAGELAPLESQLIELSRRSISNRLVELKARYQQQLAEWKERMGIAPERSIHLASQFPKTRVEIPDSSEIARQIEQHPAVRSAEMDVRAAGQNIRNARLRRIPEFDFSAGYKRLNPDWNGFMVGVSVPLPVVNRNRAGIEQSRAEQRQADFQRQQGRIALRAEWQQQWKTLTMYQEELEEIDEELIDMPQLGRRVHNGFEEGRLSLTEALNALELGADGYEAYLNQITGFYRALAALEYLTDNTYIEES